MVTAAQSSSQEKNISSPRKVVETISSSIIDGISAVVTAPFRAVKSIAQMVAKPLMFGATTFVAVHILVRPEKSREIAEQMIKKLPSPGEAWKMGTNAIETTLDISQRIYHKSLHTLGGKINPNKSKHTLLEVAKGIGQGALNLRKTTRSDVTNFLDSGLSLVETTLSQAKGKVVPSLVNSFKETFPKIAPTQGL